MNTIPPGKGLISILFAALFVAGCGGGGGSDSGSNSEATPAQPSQDVPVSSTLPVAAESDSSEATDELTVDLPETTQQVDISSVQSQNYGQAALAGSNTLSLARQSCGLSGLTANDALSQIATQHALYIQHVFANSTPNFFNAHTEGSIAGIESVTGKNNPFFTGISFQDRLLKAAYPDLRYGVVENIVQTESFNSLGTVASPEYAAQAMAKSLLAAPYHLKSLVLPHLSQTGSGMVAYTPFGKEANTNQGYVFVNTSSGSEGSVDNRIAATDGVLTYPCAGVTDTNTALYNESPSPVANTGRDLATDPIGQPVYIRIPAAETIKVSNVKFHDIKRNSDVPVTLIDSEQDPHPNTNYALAPNEAFILPITDDLNSCIDERLNRSNCGLHGNTAYEVSFDIMVDGSDMMTKQFTFTTGAVN